MTTTNIINIINTSTEGAEVSAPPSIVPFCPIDWEDLESIPDRTDALIRGLSLVMEHHNAPDPILKELDRQVHAYLDTSLNETVWLKQAKYLLTYPLSKYLRNESPPLPDVVFQAKGCLRRWMKQRLFCFNRKNTHLWYSWLQAKRSTLPVSSEVVEATYEKHFQTLSRHDPGDDLTICEIFSDPTFTRVLDNLRSTIGKEFTSDDSQYDFVESSCTANACFESSRGAGGQQFELQTLSGLSRRDDDGKPITQYDPNKEFYGMRFDTVVYTRGGRRHNVVTEIRVDYGLDEWSSLRRRSFKLEPRSRCCTIQAVLEPMKVRVISKGEALPYYSCKPLQKAMHTAMKHLCCFRLIGRPFSPTDMIDLKEKSGHLDQWFSIDYSAATDGLSWKYSGRILRYILADIPERQLERALEVLGPHNLHYPVPGKPGERVFRGVQANGQLMGSILSFPILCLANLGVYLKVTQFSQRHWSDHDRLNHVLINGDDMVYSANDSLWDYHVDIARKVGLEMSVGKAYRHYEYANINSVSTHYSLRDDNAIPWRIDYLNTGLFYGQHKVQSKGSKASVEPYCRDERGHDLYLKHVEGQYQLAQAHLGQDPSKGLVVNLNTLLEGCLPGRQDHILLKFISVHRNEINMECSGVITHQSKRSVIQRNLFLPLSSGGMGVTPPIGWKFKITKIDRNIAYGLRKCCTADKSSQHPLPGYPLNDVETVKTVPWVKVNSLQGNVSTFNLESYRLCTKRETFQGFLAYSMNKRAVSV